MRWIVGPRDGRTVRDILVGARADGDAVREGRVFVGLRRVRRGDEPVRHGDVVDVSPPRRTDDEHVRVLARTADLVAVDKPAGIPTIPDQEGAAHSILARSARALGISPSALHATSRLDRDVSGVVIFARSAAAARRLARARAEGGYDRRYVAVAAKAPDGAAGTWSDPIGRASDPLLRAVRGRNATDARTTYAVCACAPNGAALLAVAPLTGRTHQIRVHAANAGAPLVGDGDYGGPCRLVLPSGRVVEPRRIALHAMRVIVPDARGKPMVVVAPVPDELRGLWSSVGGDSAAWEAASSCALG